MILLLIILNTIALIPLVIHKKLSFRIVYLIFLVIISLIFWYGYLTLFNASTEVGMMWMISPLPLIVYFFGMLLLISDSYSVALIISWVTSKISKKPLNHNITIISFIIVILILAASYFTWETIITKQEDNKVALKKEKLTSFMLTQDNETSSLVSNSTGFDKNQLINEINLILNEEAKKPGFTGDQYYKYLQMRVLEKYFHPAIKSNYQAYQVANSPEGYITDNLKYGYWDNYDRLFNHNLPVLCDLGEIKLNGDDLKKIDGPTGIYHYYHSIDYSSPISEFWGLNEKIGNSIFTHFNFYTAPLIFGTCDEGDVVFAEKDNNWFIVDLLEQL